MNKKVNTYLQKLYKLLGETDNNIICYTVWNKVDAITWLAHTNFIDKLNKGRYSALWLD